MITARTKLFAILWLAGMAGVLSVLLIDLSAVLANLPANAELEMPFHPVIIKLLSIVQTAILCSRAQSPTRGASRTPMNGSGTTPQTAEGYDY